MRLLLWCVLCTSLQSCFLLSTDNVQDDDLPEFVNTPVITPLFGGIVPEASGIVNGFLNPSSLWIIQDSDTGSYLFQFSSTGQVLNRVELPIKNRDWEDIALSVSPENDKPYLYIADIGDNISQHEQYFIYRLEEPKNGKLTSNIETYSFVYSDGKKYNSEAFFVDPQTRDWFVITKDPLNVSVFKIPYPQSIKSQNIAEYQGSIPYHLVTAADISADGNEILLRSYLSIYYWKRAANSSVYETLKRNRDFVPNFVEEPQGESICWRSGADGFYTLSEKSTQASDPPLYFYAKK